MVDEEGEKQKDSAQAEEEAKKKEKEQVEETVTGSPPIESEEKKPIEPVSGTDLMREQASEQERFNRVDEGRTAYEPMSKNLRKRVMDPEVMVDPDRKPKNAEDVLMKQKDVYFCKVCNRTYPTPQEALECYDRCYAMKSQMPLGFKVK